jgi:thiol-disulfide isomerase/thioredoxin
MKVLLFVLLGVLGASVAHSADLTLRPVDEPGYRAVLKENSGKVVLMDIWAAWCEPCRAATPELVKIAKQLGPQGFRYVTVTVDDPGELAYAEKFLRAQNVPFPAYYRQAKNVDRWIQAVDPQWRGSLPALFLYDRKGKRAKSFIGSTPAPMVEAAIRELLAR